MLKLKKLVACAVLLALCVSPSVVLADTTATTPSAVTSSAELTTDATVMSVTFPLSVMIYVDAQGNVTTPTNMEITNNSAAPIQVTSLAITTNDGWTLDPANTNYTHYKVGQKNFSLQINGKDPSSGAINFADPINGGESLHLDLAANVSPQKSAITGSALGNMIVVVGWFGETPTNNYVLATDADFSGTTNGNFRYIGTAPYVIIPDTIKGIAVTSYMNMFNGTAVKGVKSTNPNITDMGYMLANTTSTTLEFSLNTTNTTSMWYMFSNSKAETLDMSGLNTTNVTNMSYMFYNSAATTINLSNFNTSNATNMASMFQGAKATTLDLSSFNTSKVTGTGMIGMFQSTVATTINLSTFNTSNITSINNMFRGVQVATLDLSTFDLSKVSSTLYTFRDALTTTAYARSAADATKLNSSSYKPAGLTITVK